MAQVLKSLLEGQVSLNEPEHSVKVRSKLRLKILVAEDNEVNTLLLKRFLSALSCESVCVSNGQELLKRFDSDSYDLILMDVQMPLMDGFETTLNVRARELQLGTHIPIIALTAHAQQGDRERCIQSGMDDYLSKPINRSELEEKLNRWGKFNDSIKSLKAA